MSIRGQKILIDLDDGDEAQQTRPVLASGFVTDIQEREVKKAAPPQAPKQRPSEDGFPAHRKRQTQSRFKAQRAGEEVAIPAKPVTKIQERQLPVARAVSSNDDDNDSEVQERRQIDEENQRRLDDMSEAEIQQERAELLENLSPGLLQALLKRSKLEDGGDQSDFPGLKEAKLTPTAKPKASAKKVTFAINDEKTDKNATTHIAGSSSTENLSGKEKKQDTRDEHNFIPADDNAKFDRVLEPLPSGSIHFPRPDQPPALDPNSPSFLEDLHQKYFPSLPADPEKLEWMKSATGTSSYSPFQTGLDLKDIRFAFSGTLIPPSEAAQIPVTAGLHHHGDAPDAAGYTIPELARLARSTVAAQRCIAYQTLGRILYRLGKGEFGDPSEGQPGTVGAQETLGELARGLWAEVEREQIVNICMAESEGKSLTGQRHVSAQAYATEAIWLWQKGGGRRWKTA